MSSQTLFKELDDTPVEERPSVLYVMQHISVASLLFRTSGLLADITMDVSRTIIAGVKASRQQQKKNKKKGKKRKQRKQKNKKKEAPPMTVLARTTTLLARVLRRCTFAGVGIIVNAAFFGAAYALGNMSSLQSFRWTRPLGLGLRADGLLTLFSDHATVRVASFAV